MKLFNKKISREEADKLYAKQAQGIALSQDEQIALFVFEGLSEDEARTAVQVIKPEYGKPDKEGKVSII